MTPETAQHPTVSGDEIARYRGLADLAIASTPPYPADRYRGRGVVICGGGPYFACAWVCIRMLRSLGCRLPIQLWHLAGEVDGRMRELVAAHGVECVDADLVRQIHPVRTLDGWELKCYAILHCPFREVLLLDADNVPVADPTPLFEAEEYLRAGAAFWPDCRNIRPDDPIWDICGVAYRDEPEFESGQVVVDKARCWAALRLAMHYNEHSDFYYRHILGDKETFHLAFHRLGQPYAMPATPHHSLLGRCMCQHDFRGGLVFQHRNQAKWSLHGPNPTLGGFLHEERCLEFLAGLAARWSGTPFRNEAPDASEAALAERLAGRRFRYRRVGFDERDLALEPGGLVGDGAAGRERTWSVGRLEGQHALTLAGQGAATCHLRVGADGTWRGRWLRHERMPIELVPLE